MAQGPTSEAARSTLVLVDLTEALTSVASVLLELVELPACDPWPQLVLADPHQLRRMLMLLLTHPALPGDIEVTTYEAEDWVELRLRALDPGAPADRCAEDYHVLAARRLANANGGDAWWEPDHEAGGPGLALRLPGPAASTSTVPR